MIALGTGPIPRILHEATRREWTWGSWDCGQWLGVYIESIHGVNPALQWEYRTEFGAKRLIAEAGGMVAHVGRTVEPFGFARTATPSRGDIVVVDAPEGETGAILLKSKVARIMRPSGYMISELPILAAWKV